MYVTNPGPNPPKEVNVVIEVSAQSYPVKYEYNKDTHMLFVDRFLYTSMSYPCNYGFIPGTLGGDGDPLDVLVYSTYPIMPRALIVVRPISVMLTEDEKGEDAKLLAVPLEKVDPFLSHVKDDSDLPEVFKKQLEHFFENYKGLESGKWVKIRGWGDAASAKNVITKGIAQYLDSHNHR